MAKKKSKKTENNSKKDKNVSKYVDEYTADFDALSTIHDDFEEKEKILLGVKVDSITKNSARSQIVDPTLQTAVLKQNNETMAQLPTGKVDTYMGDKGKGMLMNLLLEKHITPNANTQFDMYTKFWLLSLYRKVYGSFGVLVDYQQSDLYTGADFSLIPIRSIVPQKGKYTVESCEHLSIRSVVTKDWLLKRDTKYWQNLDKLLEDAPEATEDTDYQTYTEQKYNTDISSSGKKKENFELITRYEGDRWVTFSKDSKILLRDIDNPHDNGEIPVVMAHSYPLLDRFIGLGEFERGINLHRAQSSLINLYMDGVKMSIFPPLKADVKNLVMKTIKRDPGSIWFVKNGQMGAIDQLQLSPQGLNTFQSTYGFLKGAMLSLTNTTDTSISQTVDSGLGKTPQALKMQQMTQSMRSAFDRKMMDIAIEKVYNKLIDVTVSRQEKPIKLKFMEDEITQIRNRYPDINEMVDEKNGELIIKPDDIKDTKYKFNIDAGSTIKKDEMVENETLTSLIELIFQIPGAAQQIEQTGIVKVGDKQINFGETVKRWIITSGVSDWDKIVEDAVDMGVPEDMLSPEMMGQPQGQPPQGMPPMGQPMPPEMMGMPPQQPMGMPPQGMPPQGQQPMGQPMQQPMPQQMPPQDLELEAIMQEIINGNSVA